MKNKSIITIILLVSIVIGYTVYKNQGHPVNKNVIVSCNNINTEDVYLKVKNTESKISSYSSSTKDVMGQSTEGGEQTDYMSNGERVLVKQIFFGETGKSEASYYLEGGIVFYIKKKTQNICILYQKILELILRVWK